MIFNFWTGYVRKHKLVFLSTRNKLEFLYGQLPLEDPCRAVREFREQMGGDECLTDTEGNLHCFQTDLFTQRHNLSYTAPSNAWGLIQL